LFFGEFSDILVCSFKFRKKLQKSYGRLEPFGFKKSSGHPLFNNIEKTAATYLKSDILPAFLSPL
jgi:hypothetical protein